MASLDQNSLQSIVTASKMLWTSDSPFSYDSLPAASTEFVRPSDNNYQKHNIRLVRLSWPSLRQKVPRCKLRTVATQIGDPSPLECRALSYVHGSDNLMKDVYVNGKKLPVRHNLYACLEVLSRDGSRWGDLWIDQISINTANAPERNQQVRHMGEIYRRAKEVIAWLGHGLHSDLVAIDVIRNAYEEQEQGRDRELTLDEIDLLKSFIKNPYFHRLWVADELVLARKITLLMGDRELSWDTLISVYSRHIFTQIPPSLRDITADCTSLQRLHIAKTQHEVLDIFDVLNGFCKYECSDPRDHLFGLLGLLDNQTVKVPVTVDYSLSVYTVYCNFCFEILNKLQETEQLFDLLVMLGHAMGFEAVFYGDCQEEEILNFFHGVYAEAGEVRANVRNLLQAKTVMFQEAAKFLAMGIPAEYDILSGKRIF